MKRWMHLFISCFLLVGILAACSSGNSGSSQSTQSTNKEGQTPTNQSKDNSKDEVIELTFWGDWGGEGQIQFETMINDFNESQDKIKVTYVLQQDMITKFLTAATSGESPDIMFWDRWRTSLYAPKNVLHPINEYMERDGINKDDYYAEALKELTYKDKLYGLPLTVDARALFYNKKLLADAGVEPPTTWDELAEAAKKLTKWNGDKLEVAGFSMSDPGLFNMYLQQAGGSILTEDLSATNFNNENGIEVLNYWKKLLHEDKVYKLGFEAGLGEGNDAFVTGKVAMHYTGPWMLSTYQKYGADLDFGVVMPPKGPNGDTGSVMGGFGLVIAEGSKHKEEAWEFVKWWLANKENSFKWSQISMNLPGFKPALQDAFYTENPIYQPFIETLDIAKIRPQHPGYSVMEVDGLIPNLELFIEGKQDAATTLKKAQEQGDRLLLDNQDAD